MSRKYCYSLLLLLITLMAISSNCGYEIEQPQLQLMGNGIFSLSIKDHPGLKWVKFKVEIYRELQGVEETLDSECTAMYPQQEHWSCTFDKRLKDQDIVSAFLVVRGNDTNYRAVRTPIRNDEQNSILKVKSTTRSSLETSTNRNSNQFCLLTMTSLLNNNNKQICQYEIIFEDNFDDFNEQYWTNEIRIPSTRFDSEFVIYNGSVIADNGILKITANLSDHGINRALDLGERCTSNCNDECRYVPTLHHFLPPITSGRINTAKYFNFKYGRIEVKAKVPKGDWLFPIIALQPLTKESGSTPFANGEIRIAFVRGNQNLMWENTNIGGTCLFGGSLFSLIANERHKFMSNITLDKVNKREKVGDNGHFGDDFHVYSLTWKPDELLIRVDGIEYGKIPIDFKDSVPLDGMFYITLGLAAGGHGDFPENIENQKPWENTDPKAIMNFYKQRNNWLRTWLQPSLEIDYVRVYAI